MNGRLLDRLPGHSVFVLPERGERCSAKAEGAARAEAWQRHVEHEASLTTPAMRRYRSSLS